MHIICPHCHNPIELVKLTPREEIACPTCGSSFRMETGTTTGAESIAGQKLGKFHLLETLGQGAFGTVYKARDVELDRTVAIKVPRAGNLAGPQELDRFLREARSVAQLRHPSIVPVHEVGQQDGVPYLVSDFVQGVTLADLLSARRPGFRESAELVAAVADALQYAHEQGVVHRDVKPSNIMIGDDGKPSVMDFGLAKREAAEITMTIEGQVLGTPAYMPPEQARGEGHAVDARGDVYSLGVVLYQLLTGELPFRGTQRMLLHQVLHDEPRPLRRLNDSIPRDLETICLKCLQKEAARRYSSAADLAADLGRWQKGEPTVARPVGRTERAAKWVRRNPVLAGMTAAVMLALLAGTTVSMVFTIAERQQAELATKNEADAIAKGKELATANDDLKRSRDDLKLTADDLKLTADDLKRSRDTLEGTLARSLLRPLALQGADKPMTEPEWEALWELATNRGGRLPYRFVEEASRTPVTSRQLRDRAALALPAAVGLDAERRAEVEALLMARLDDPALSGEQKTDLALAASAWDGLSSAAADRTARQLTRAMTYTTDPNALRLAQGLSAVATHMEPKDVATVAAHAATILVQAMKDTNDPVVGLPSLAMGVSVLAAHMEAREAATVTAQAATTLVQLMKAYKLNGDSNALASRLMAPGLSAVAAYMQARDAAQAATTLLQVIKDTKDPSALIALAQGLSALAARMEANDVAQAATTLVQIMKDTKNPNVLYWLTHGLSPVAAHLEAKDAATVTAQAAATIVQAMKDTKDPKTLRLLAQGLSPELLAQGLSPVAACLDAKDAAQAAPILVQALKETKDPNDSRVLAHALSAVAARLEPQDAAQVAAALVQAVKDTKAPGNSSFLGAGLSAVAARLEPKDATLAATTLVQAMKNTQNPSTMRALAQGLSAVAVRMEPKDAATTLVQAMKDTQDYYALQHLAWGLSVVTARLEARYATQAATSLVQLMKDSKDNNAVSWLALGLSAVAPRMEPKDAATTLVQAMKDTQNPHALSWVAQGLSAVAVRMESKDAATVRAQAATSLVQAMRDTKNSYALPELARGLSAVAAQMEGKDACQAAVILVQAMRDTKNSYSLSWLARGLSALAARMEAKDAATFAAQAATTLLQVIKDTKDPNELIALAQGLSALAARMEAKDLVQAMKDTKDPDTLRSLAQGLSAVAANMKSKDAAQAANTLLQAMKDAKNPYDLLSLAPSLSAVTARLEPKDAATVTAQAATVTAQAATVIATSLVQAMKVTKNPNTPRQVAQGLSAVLSVVPSSEISTRSASAASAMAFPTGTGHPLTALVLLIPAAEPLPCRLSTQQLVELLKMPTCIGAAQRFVLDHLGNLYKRHFADQWEFVRFAKENLPDIDLISPPQRPEPAAPAAAKP